MAISKLPRTITKLDLFVKAQERFQEWVDMYADSYTSVEQMYDNMSCSSYSGDPALDFPDDVKDEQDSIIRYHYKDGTCFFVVDDIEVEVLNLRSMRKSSRVGKETYADVCILAISYTDSDGNFMYHPIPNAWMYGSTSDSFDKGKPVHREFIDAARKYIKEHSITKEMQEVE